VLSVVRRPKSGQSVTYARALRPSSFQAGHNSKSPRHAGRMALPPLTDASPRILGLDEFMSKGVLTTGTPGPTRLAQIAHICSGGGHAPAIGKAAQPSTKTSDRTPS
jgi:hypothetical protein